MDLGSKQALNQVSVSWQTANARTYGYDIYGSNNKHHPRLAAQERLSRRGDRQG